MGSRSGGLDRPGPARPGQPEDREPCEVDGRGKERGVGTFAITPFAILPMAALADQVGAQPTIAGAGLDVFEDEPKVPQRLLDLHKVVLTPHIGSATAATRQAMADLACQNLVLHLGGQAVLTPVPECQ